MTQPDRYSETTRDITVAVTPIYLEDQSNPDEGRFVWAYNVEIENNGLQTVQLRERSWEITDANGSVEHVNGPGVVGEQPILKPGDRFEYASGCPLPTSSGFMVGHYTMAAEDGETFDIAIPAFALDLPGARMRVN